MPEELSRSVVRRLRWTEPGFHGHMLAYRRRLPASFSVATFDDRNEARAECRRREREARFAVNPFSMGGAALFHQSSLDADRLHDWLLDHGVQHPPGEGDWRGWCYNKYPMLSRPEQEAVWEALDKVRFFEVAEEPTRVAYVVIRFCWKIGGPPGEPLHADCEGGEIVGLFRSAADAEARRAETQDAAWEDQRGYIEDGANHESYIVNRLSGHWPVGELTVDEAPFVETLEVPMMDDVEGAVAYLVQRQAIDPEGCLCRNENGDPTEGVVPLAIFATREGAEAEAAKLERNAREIVSPFAFIPPHIGLDYLTSLPYEEMRTRAETLGLVPPGRKKNPWAGGEWGRYLPDSWIALWDECVDAMTDEQRDGVWAMLDRLSFHSVVEVRLG